jgi:hypothetical protein
MRASRLEQPINRLGFVIFCLSLLACALAFSVVWRTHYSWDFRWVGHLLLDSGYEWQQSLFKLGFFGALLGAILTWNLLSSVRRLAVWISTGNGSRS